MGDLFDAMVSLQPTNPLKNRTIWIAFGLLILVGGISVFVVRSRLQSRQAAIEAAAEPPPERVNVAALGRIEPESRVIDVAAAETGIISQLLVSEGDQVKAGQVLAYLDTYDVRKAERDYAAAQLVDARRQLSAKNQLGGARIQEASTEVDQIRLPRTEEIRAQEATIRTWQAQLRLATLERNRFRDLWRQGALSQQELDRQQAEVDRLASELASANATVAQLVAAQNTELETATAKVASAEADLVLSQAETAMTSAESNLALAEARLARTVVVAPADGQILDIYVEPGEFVGEGRLLSMGNTREMVVVAEVYETDVSLVKAGQKVTIESRNGAFPDTLTGRVEEVGLQIFKNDVLDDDPAANADARVVEVRVAVDQDEVIDQLTNLQVDVQIGVDES